MLHKLGYRPPPPLETRVRGMPMAWRPIIEQELRAAKMPFRELMSKRRTSRHVSARTAIWRRIEAECGASIPSIARRFQVHHTTVYYHLGWLNR